MIWYFAIVAWTKKPNRGFNILGVFWELVPAVTQSNQKILETEI